MPLLQLNIGVLGLGQIGGSIATRLVSCSAHSAILGYDVKPQLRDAAKQSRAVTEIAGSETELVAASDLASTPTPSTTVAVRPLASMCSMKPRSCNAPRSASPSSTGCQIFGFSNWPFAALRLSSVR